MVILNWQAHLQSRYVENPNGCWDWTGYIGPEGYGEFRLRCGPATKWAHRAFYIMYKGDIPEGMEIDHLCRRRCCVNPEHLETVAPAENSRRGANVISHYAERDRCKHGHLLSGENVTVRWKNGRPFRDCRACWRRRNNGYYQARKTVT